MASTESTLPSSLQTCNEEDILYLFNTFIVDDKIHPYKEQIIAYLKENNVNGQHIASVLRTNFGKNINKHCGHTKINRAAIRTHDKFVKFDFNTVDLWIKNIINQRIRDNNNSIATLCKENKNNLVDIDKITKKQMKMDDIYIVEGYMCLHTRYYKIYIPQEIIDLILFMFEKSVIQIKITDNIKDISDCIIYTANFIKQSMKEQECMNTNFKPPFELDMFITVDIKTLYNDHSYDHSDYLSGSCTVSCLNDSNINLIVDKIKYPETLPAERHAIILNKCDCTSTHGQHYELSVWEQDEYCTVEKLSRKVMKRSIVPNNNIYSPTTDQLSCQLLVFIFYVQQKGKKIEMECCMMQNEEIKRFYGDDIINKLPQYFEMNETNFQFIEEEKKEKRIKYLFADAMQQFDTMQDKGDIECKRKKAVIYYGNRTIEKRIDTNQYIKAKIESKEQIPMEQQPCIVNVIQCDDRILFQYDSDL